MSKWFLTRAVLLVTIVTGLAAIGIAVVSTELVAARQTSVESELSRANGMNLDEQLLELAKQDPAFGGMFFDDDGRLTVFVLKSALASADGFGRLAAMSLGIEAAFRDHPIMAAAAAKRINVLPGEYSFVSLYAWHQAVTADVSTLRGVVFTDIAEDLNRLRIGIERPEVAAAVRQRLSSLGIPGAAVRIQLTSPIRPMASLRSKFRPLIGGIQIHFGPGLCTLGFLAVRAGVPGMITNSHCTLTQGGVQKTIFHQPLASGTTNRIGIEVRDSAYFTGKGCPSGKKCRYSDSAFARIPHTSGPSVTSTRGLIARPVKLNSLTVTTGRFRITSEASVPLMNETLNKVGRTTGWSQGKVIGTCINTNVGGTNIQQLCQDVVKARVNSGDSGSPVFRITKGSDVRLYGVLWGGGSIPGIGTVFVFSALGTRNLQRSSEMGRLTTCAAGFSC